MRGMKWGNLNTKQRRLFLSLIIGIPIIAIIGIGIWLASTFANVAPKNIASPTPTPQPTTPTPQPTSRVVTVSAMGDMLPHDSVNQAARQPDGTYNYLSLLELIKPVIADSEIVFCNQEVSSAGENYGITGYPSFNAPTQFAADLSNFGCNTINLATNHLHDKGQGAIDVTRQTWDELKPLMISGANRSLEEQNTVSFSEIQGMRFAFVAFADYSNTGLSNPFSLNIASNTSLVQNLMSQATSQADVVIVSTHWGTEYSNGVNSQQREFASQLASLGADVIIGTGPHVLEPVEWIPGKDGKQTLVWYSIGNLLSTQLEIPQLIGGVAKFDVVKNPEGVITISSPRFIPTYMHYEWTPAQAASGDLLARTNLKVYPLQEAAEALSRSLFSTTVEAQYEYVRSVLGEAVTVE